MDKKELENLSKCMDNEMEKDELSKFMNKVLNDPELLHLWGLKYNLSVSLQTAAKKANHKFVVLPKKK